MESLVAYTSLGGSIFSAAATLYFWLIKANRERPSLKPYAIDREFFLGAMTPQSRQIGFKVGIVIANYSSLPNALLGAKLQLRGRDGQWIDLTNVSFDEQTPLPFNLAPLHTTLLRLNGTLNLPYLASLEDGNKTIANYLREHVAEPRMLRLEVRSLNDRADRYEIALPDAAG